jgi:hypothetical protein
VYLWCKTGEQITEDRLKAVYAAALARGKAIAEDMQRRRSARRAARTAQDATAPAGAATPSTEVAQEPVIHLPPGPASPDHAAGSPTASA